MSEAIPDALQFGVVVVPVGDPGDLDDEGRSRIPAFDELYWLDDELLEDLAVAVDVRVPVFLHGPTGCGKSSGVQMLGALINRPCIRINMNADTRASDLLGEKTLVVDPESGQSVVEWADGPVTKAWRQGWWLTIDEYTAAPPGVNLTLQALLELDGVLTLAGNGGEVVPRHPLFRLFATDNTLGRGDETGLYDGTNTVNEATLDRFAGIACGYPPAEQEAEILVSKTGIDAAMAKKMVESAGLVRGGFQKAECFATFSTRRLLAWAAFSRRFMAKRVAVGSGAYMKAVARGYRLAVGSKLQGDDAAYIGGVVQRVTGVRTKK